MFCLHFSSPPTCQTTTLVTTPFAYEKDLKRVFNRNILSLCIGMIVGVSPSYIFTLTKFDNVFHVYLMNGLQKYQKKNFFHGGFLR